MSGNQRASTFTRAAQGADRVTRKYSTGISPWQERIRATGITQKTIAALTGMSEISISKQFRGITGKRGEPSRFIVAIIVAWEMMGLEQREEWLTRLAGKAAVPANVTARSLGQGRLCDAVRARREELSLSREQVGNATGFGRHTIKDFEDGKDVPLSVAVKIAESVGLTFDPVDTASMGGVVTTPRKRDDSFELDIGDSLPENVEAGR